MTDRDIRTGQVWSIESPDNRATWRKVRIIEFTTRNRAIVQLLSGPFEGEVMKVNIDTFIQKEAA